MPAQNTRTTRLNIENDSFGSDVSDVLHRRDATVNESRYVVAELADAGSYMISMGHRVEGALDTERLRFCFAEVVGRHEAMRTGFVVRGAAIMARVHKARDFGFHHTQRADISAEVFRDWAVPLVFDGIEPDRPETLVRLLVAEAKGYWRFTVAMHHSISDGFSRGVVNRELLKLYAGETLADVGAYSDFIGNAHAIDDAKVETTIDAFPTPGRIPPDGRLGQDDDTRGVFIERALPDVGPSLRKLGKEHGATKFGVLGAIYALGLSAFSGDDQLSSFFQSEGRKILGAPNSVVGPFSNTLPLDLSFDPEASFATFARDISTRVQTSVELEAAPVTERIAEIGKAPTVSLNMFPPAPRIRAGDLEVGPREFLDRRTEFDLNLVWSEDSGVLRARAFYDGAKLSSERAEAFLDLQHRLITCAIGSPELSCQALLKTAQVTAAARIPATDAPALDRRIHDAFFKSAEADPGAQALVTSSGAWTYGALRDRALSYAGALEAAGADRDKTVALFSRRHPDLVAAILGVSAYGAPFVVIDAEYPWLRVQSILHDASVQHAFSIDGALRDTTSSDVVLLEPVEGTPDATVMSRGKPRAIAYHLFTSGTTGEPKRISHPDATLVRFVDWQAKMLGTGAFRTMLLAGLSHDPVMRDIFLALSSGGAIILPSDDELRSPEALRNLIREAAPDTLHITPASGQLIAMGAEEDAAFPSVTSIFWGGDRLDPSGADRWRAYAPGARQFNLYGTSETPQAALIHEISSDDGSLRVPVGYPPPWNGVRLEWDGVPVGHGALGEIVVELSDPVYMAQSEDPIYEHRTGDYGFMLPGKGVQLVGRRDDQVKVNALRIELSEIAGAAETVAGVRHAIALQTENEPRDLVLFAVADDGMTSGKLRAGLERALPKYMVPARVVLIDRMPLTPNGKIDLTALRTHALPLPSDGDAFTPPETPEEKRLTEIWQDILGIPEISVTESFLDLGGDSLTAIRLMMEMERVGLPETSVQAILQGATIRELARARDTATPADEHGPMPTGPLLSRSSLHALRGLLVCILIIAHWMPALVERVSVPFHLDTVLSPVFKMSTPGFAIIFGVSLGYFKFGIYRRQPDVFFRQIRIGVAILLGAMVLLSIIDLSTASIKGVPITWHSFFMTYYNVLGFYLLAILTAPLWFRAIDRMRNVWIGTIGLIALFIALDLGMRGAFLRYEPEGFVQLLRLYATAKFSYFSLGVGALVGVLIGLAIRQQPHLPLRPAYLGVALALVALGITWGNLQGELETLFGQSRRVEYWKWFLYLGSVMSLSALFWFYFSTIGIGNGLRGAAMKLLVSIGVLALPIFVFHGLILSLKSLTDALGIPDAIGIGIVLLLFFGLGGLAVHRVQRAFFA